MEEPLASGGTFGSATSIGTDWSEGTTLDHDDIQQLGDYVRQFSDALSQLKSVFLEKRIEYNSFELMKVAAHDYLANVLSILKSVLQKYSAIQSVDVLTAAARLIAAVKNNHYGSEGEDVTGVVQGVDQLALSFSNRLSEYLLGDIDTGSKYTSDENLAEEKERKPSGATLSAQEIDNILKCHEAGVEIGLYRAKVWSRYARSIISYVEKRAQVEMEHAKKVAHLAQSVRPVLKEEGFLPFQSIYCTSLDQDIELSGMCQATANLLLTHKFIEPLTGRITEHERMRKALRDVWLKEVKKVHEAAGDLRKARSVYIQRQQDYEKAREAVGKAETDDQSSSKLEKKRKVEEECLYKAAEAETTYKACIAEANQNHKELERLKMEVLAAIRELIYQCDQTMKAVTVTFFQLLHKLATPVPVQLQTLWESSRLYEPGAQYMEFVKQLAKEGTNKDGDRFVFEPYNEMNKAYDRNRVSEDTRDLMEHVPLYIHGLTSDRDIKFWPSDSESISDTESMEDSSPHPSRHHRHPVLGEGNLVDRHEHVVKSQAAFSKAASTHKFRKLKTPSKCRECDSYVYFQGLECEVCGLPCHRKCLQTLAIQCGNKGPARRMTTFGVDVQAHLQKTKTDVPIIVTKCIQDVEERGLTMKGIYRISGVKSKVEQLCQMFEMDCMDVDLQPVNPMVVANVLKLYFRQLPEPLLTFKLHDKFIQLAKEFPGSGRTESNGEQDRAIVENFTKLLSQLPKANSKTTAVLMQHLNRVAKQEELNHMSAGNLGIVFGPNLLRGSNIASLDSLLDTENQARAIELMILFAKELFGEDKISPKCAAVEKQESKSQNQYAPLSGDLDQKPVEDTGGSDPIYL